MVSDLFWGPRLDPKTPFLQLKVVPEIGPKRGPKRVSILEETLDRGSLLGDPSFDLLLYPLFWGPFGTVPMHRY